MSNDELNTQTKTVLVVDEMIRSFAYVVGLILIILAFVKGGIWMNDTISPFLVTALGWLSFTLCVFGGLSSIFRYARAFGGAVMLLSSTGMLFSVWVDSLVIAKVAGSIWLIVGVVLAGFGVIPVAIVAAIINQAWFVVLEIVLTVVIALAFRFGSFAILETVTEIEK
jgi:hypothetical protein